MSESFELDAPDRITVGAVGEPGKRVFFLQARQGRQLVTLKLEKLQVAALTAWIAKTLEDLPAPGELPEDEELEPEEFVEASWVVGSLGGTYDVDVDRILLIAGEAVQEDDSEDLELELGPEPEDEELEDDDEDEQVWRIGATARFFATREQMAALAIRGTRLVEAGRPPCPLCGYPLDPAGHACPRTNGHRPPAL
jgi:uncharacterized repeat protein (TIGR03847 family)